MKYAIVDKNWFKLAMSDNIFLYKFEDVLCITLSIPTSQRLVFSLEPNDFIEEAKLAETCK